MTKQAIFLIFAALMLSTMPTGATIRQVGVANAEATLSHHCKPSDITDPSCRHRCKPSDLTYACWR